MLLILAGPLFVNPSAVHEDIDTFGFLQLLWLLQSNLKPIERLSQVSRPTMENLRATGMINVNLSGTKTDTTSEAGILLNSYTEEEKL
jgi:hypothetical protein